MDDAESARRERHDEYYRYSPLGIFNDSYFTHPVPYNEEQDVTLAQAGSTGFGMNIDSQCAANYVGYQPYQTQVTVPMDLELLSAENYQEGPYDRELQSQHVSGTQVYGGLLVGSPVEAKAPSPPATTKTRKSSMKETSKSSKADEHITRQRGRPRLDNRDQTAAEVSLYRVDSLMIIVDFRKAAAHPN